MTTVKLHHGVWIRQLLRGKRKVRVTFTPDDTKKPAAREIRIIDEGEKKSWAALFGDSFTADLDTGITILRFDKGNLSGTAIFLPQESSREITIHPFRDTGSDPEHDTRGLREFNQCMDGKKATALATNTTYNPVTAFSQCINQIV